MLLPPLPAKPTLYNMPLLHLYCAYGLYPSSPELLHVNMPFSSSMRFTSAQSFISFTQQHEITHAITEAGKRVEIAIEDYV